MGKTKTTDRRAVTSPVNARKGGRPRTVGDGEIYSIKLPRTLYDWLRSLPTEEVRSRLTRWMIEEHIV